MRVLRSILCAVGCALALVTAAAQTAPAPAPAGGTAPADLYLGVCDIINRADQGFAGGDLTGALSVYREAAQALETFRQQHPGWNNSLVELRVRHVADRLAVLEQNPAAAAILTNLATPVATAPHAPPPQPPGLDLTNEFRTVVQQLRAAEADNALLLARLREALASTPAVLDPRELERADQRIRALQAENDLLRQQLAGAVAAPAAAATTTGGSAEVRRLRREIEDLNRRLKAQSDAAVQLLAEKTVELNRQAEQLQALRAGQPAPASPALAAIEQENASLRQQLAAAQTAAANARDSAAQLSAAQARLAEAQSRIESLQLELAARPTATTGSELARATEQNLVLQRELSALRQRGASLEEQLTAANARASAAPATTELANLRQRAEAAEASTEALRQENAALEASARAAAMSPTDPARVRELESRLRELEAHLADANRQLAAPPSKRLERRLDSLNQEVVTLRSRLNVYETKAVPFTKEELALFTRPAPNRVVAARTLPSRSSSRGAMAELQTRGERQLAAGELPQAEATFTQAVQVNEREVRALCNLANSQAGQGKFTEAEATIARALALAPNDPASLAVRGYILYSQDRFDEALNDLSRAASLSPKDPGIQVLLGVTLAEKGLRPQAETAFRKALQVQPNHADAHRNLAVIYLTQQPPRAQLARWHYQKAVASGSPPSAELEREIETAAAAAR